MEYVRMENYSRCLQAVDKTLRLWGVGFVKTLDHREEAA